MESPLARQVVRQVISQEPDVEIVAEVTDPMDLLVAINNQTIDAVIHSWGETPETQSLCSHLFAEHPNLLVIGIAPGEEFGYAHLQIANIDGIFSLLRATRIQDQYV